MYLVAKICSWLLLMGVWQLCKHWKLGYQVDYQCWTRRIVSQLQTNLQLFWNTWYLTFYRVTSNFRMINILSSVSSGFFTRSAIFVQIFCTCAFCTTFLGLVIVILTFFSGTTDFKCFLFLLYAVTFTGLDRPQPWTNFS